MAFSEQGQPIGYQSAVVNGQLVNIAPLAAYDPLVFAGAYSGPGWPRQGVYDIPPILPSAASGGAAWSDTASDTGGYGLSGGTHPTATDENGSPFHPTKSPLWWAVGGIIAALLFLHYVVYK